MVNPWDPNAEAEMRRCYADLGLLGVKIHPVRQGVALDRHGVLDGFFRLCEEFSAVFFAHGASEAFNGPGKFEEMARSFPSVPLVIGHSGTPWGLAESIEVGRHCPNVYYATALADRRQLRAVIDALGADRVVVATDAPFNQFDREIQKVRDISSPDEAALILGGNTLRLLGEPVASKVA
jgi:predicted TIM-barrel fold metal-dependent hydrolase